MKCRLLAVLFSLFWSGAFAQDIRKYVNENAVSIATIDPASVDYADLKALGEAIGDARVVMLGEQDHGDAPTFLAKTRLVKYLHEQKGFNVLAFESDFYGLTKGWDNGIKQPDSVRHFLRYNIFPHWTRSDACQYLFNQYIPATGQTSTPLQLAGFDSQVVLGYSRTNLKNDLNNYLTTSQLTNRFTSSAEYQAFLDAVQELIVNYPDPSALSSPVRKALSTGLQRLKAEPLEGPEAAYWNLIIDSLMALNIDAREPRDKARDKAMASNLRFLVDQKYRGQKVIVWAANTHVMKRTDQLKSRAKNFSQVIFDNMGTDFVRDSARAATTYVLGFSSYQGAAGRLGSQTSPVQVPNPDGLENWIPATIAYGFVDFQAYNNRFGNPDDPFLMKGPMHFTVPAKVVKIPWNLVYDGIFFVRDMYPTKQVE